MGTILDEIVERKRLEIATLPPCGDPGDLAPRRSLQSALERAPGPLALIAEIKRRSPSRPMIREDFDPRAMARSYESGGAAALSVLTDGPSFGGSLADLQAARQSCGLPVLRKDFILDSRQIAQAKTSGADAILLVAACLPDGELAFLLTEAARWDVEALVEVHDEAELDRALAAGATLVGINNRDLRTFSVDLGTTVRLCQKIRSEPTRPKIVAESGIKTAADVALLARAGCDAMLVGESLLVQADLAAAARALLSPA